MLKTTFLAVATLLLVACTDCKSISSADQHADVTAYSEPRVLTRNCTDCKSTSSADHADVTAYSEPRVLTMNCSDYIEEHEYILLENGSLLLPSSEVFERGRYYLENDTAFVCAEEVTPVEVKSTGLSYDFSHEFLVCSHILVDPDEYELLQNGSIHIGIYGKVLGPRDFYLTEQGAYVCLPQFDEMMDQATREEMLRWRLNKFSDSFTYVTYTGLVLSILSLVSHLGFFCAVPSLRNLPGCCLAALSLSLLLAYACFLAIDLVGHEKTACMVLGLCVYDFFLSSFFWMNAIAFDVWRSFRSVMRELRISSHRVPRRRFLLYSLYSWLVPATLTALVRLADTTDIVPEDFRPGFGKICWFGNRKSLMVFFAVPLGVVLLLNGAFFLDVTCLISRATLRTTQPHEATLRKRFFMFMRLALIMGLTWIVGLVAAYADNMVLWYLFIVLNTLQGLFIFIVFSCSSKVKSLCFKRFGKQPLPSGNTSVRTISHTSAGI